jgi:Flp pilus assembly pilin Flp
MKMRRFNKGQSTLEYVIILAAIVGAIIAVAAAFKPKLQGTYDTLGNKMQDTVSKVSF